MSPPAVLTSTQVATTATSTIGRGIYFGHFRLKKLRLHRSAAKKSRQRLWHDDAASARFQPSSGRGRRSRWRAPPRSVGEFVCSWGHHSGRHALALLRCDGSAATKTSWRCAPSRRAHPPPALRHARKGPRDPQSMCPPDFSARVCSRLGRSSVALLAAHSDAADPRSAARAQIDSPNGVRAGCARSHKCQLGLRADRAAAS